MNYMHDILRSIHVLELPLISLRHLPCLGLCANWYTHLALPCVPIDIHMYIGDLNSVNWAASVAQLVELQPRILKVVHSSPTRGSNFSLPWDSFVLSFTSVWVFIMYSGAGQAMWRGGCVYYMESSLLIHQNMSLLWRLYCIPFQSILYWRFHSLVNG